MKIIEIDNTGELWRQLLEVLPIYQPGSRVSWLTAKKQGFISSHTMLSISEAGEILGFMRFCVRELPGLDLTEATGEALGVKPEARNNGIGRALEERSMKMAKEKGCYQFRTFMTKEAEVLQHIKISMKYGIYPDRTSDYWQYIKVL